jgi:hypothetical protein
LVGSSWFRGGEGGCARGGARWKKGGVTRVGHVGWLADGLTGPKSRREIPSEFKLNFGISPRLQKTSQGDLGGILMWGFFLNYPRLSKNFTKIQYAMSCNAS